MHRVLLFFLISLLFISCESKPSENQQFKGFISKNLPNANFAISIPLDYKIVENRRADFSIYHIHYKDSTKKAGFTATIYIGNYPSKFSADGCKASTKDGPILDEVASWETYDCENGFFTQTLARNKNNHGWDQMIHASGRSKTRAGIDTVLYIFSTLKAKD